MLSLNLNLCGLEIQINTMEFLNLDGLERMFLSNDTKVSELTLICQSVNTIAISMKELLRETDERKVFRRGTNIWRGCSTDKEKTLYTLLHYDLEDYASAQMQIRTDDWKWASKRLWQNIALPQLIAPFGALIIHASYIEFNGKAILFTASSGTGKSTQAALWEKYRGAVVCNGDKAGLRIRDGILYAYGLPFCGTSKICKNITLPVAAIVVLSQAPENHVEILNPIAAAQAVLANIYADRYIPEEWSRALNLTLDVVTKVPVLHLACTPDERAVEALEKYL